MHPFHDKFTAGQVAEITGATNADIQNWIKRGRISGQSLPEGGGSQGKHRQFSFHNLMEIAVAKALTVAGMSNLEDVFYAAAHFAHFGDLNGLRYDCIRLPGLPYAAIQSRTLIVAGQGWSNEIVIAPRMSAFDLFADMAGSPTGPVTGSVWVDASEIFRQTMTRAGFDPDAIMQAAYRK